MCNGSTADSDSVCWGSNPYSPAIKTAFHLEGHFLFYGRGIEDSEPQRRRRGVRIPHSKIGKLAYQAQSAGIFAKGEYPYSPARKKHLLRQVLFSVKFVPAERVKYADVCEIAYGSEMRFAREENEFYFTFCKAKYFTFGNAEYFTKSFRL